MQQHVRSHMARLLFLLLIVPLVAACGGTTPPANVEVQTVEVPVVVTATPDPNAEPTEATEPDQPTEEETETTDTPEPEPTAETASNGEPHPILSDVRVRQAMAHCTNRSELISSVYPFLAAEEQAQLLMDSFVPQGHWALSQDITTYPFDPEVGKQLLEEAGWVDQGEGETRINAEQEPLSLELTTTDAEFRQIWTSVFVQQMRNNCGIEIIPKYAPASWWFGGASGLQRRDFELGAYAWVGQADPSGVSLYACSQIPLPANNWEGQNYMGWCNETADKAILAANNTLDRQERIAQYATFQQAFTQDMVSLPVFNRFEASAASNNLVNFRDDPTIDSYVANITDWQLSDGADTVILGFSQEPASLFLVVESASVANIAGSLVRERIGTSYDYDYQPAGVAELPTIENGAATNETIEVSEGDMVWSTSGEPVELAAGIEVVDANGETIIYEDGTIEMKKLSVTFNMPEGLTWEDGEPVKQADFELGYAINCDPDVGAVSQIECTSMEDVEFTSDTAYTIHYLPGAQWPEYFVLTWGTYSNLYTMGAYPAHQVLSDGRVLADVPASEWSTLPEIAERPLSYGPYRVVDWQKGQRMTLEANPFYYRGEPAIKTIIIEFYEDTNQAVAQLLNGSVDVLGRETLGAGPELETVLQEGEAGSIQVYPIASPTWEHIDMNLFIVR
ncbi:MAG: peptide ABC transporter substrate-binding protein [Chloroflexaceae bacterium]|nr:peptide ABC transporter substrate-binding protein [Chloroflexaceae bacterium]